jgi:nucleoside-diphosphate-sugar epimerase
VVIVSHTDHQSKGIFMTTILLTGATGLVGSRLLPRLAEAGFACRALVRRDTQVPAGTTPVRGDLGDPDSLAPAVEGVDAIVHLAALFRTHDEAAIWRANLDGTRNLIAAVQAHAPRARFVMASTSNVYDDDAARPGREDDACAPTQAYPASKLAAEEHLRASGLTWSILRLPFIYGDSDGHLAMIPPLAPTLGLHPAHTYSVAHHRDVMTAVGLALSGAMDGQIVNIADDAPVTVFQMSDLAGDPIEGSAEPLANPWAGRVDTTRARELGFRPSVASVYEAARAGIL